MQVDMGLIERIYAESPAWVFWWTRVIDASNWLLIPFAFVDRRAHWALTAWLGNVIIILLLYTNFGYVRILGLSHILMWTPLLIFLLRERKPFAEENWAGKYLYWFMAVITVSLVFDYVDVAKYLMGYPEYP